MYYSLNGKLIYKNLGSCAIECGGVGYKLRVPTTTYVALPELGNDVFIYTHLSVKEDSMTLFGFITEDELSAFQLVTSVSGVGPKVGLAILSDIAVPEIYSAVSADDYKVFTAASGVGPKLAQRIVLELKDKVAKIVVPMMEHHHESAKEKDADKMARSEARDALVGLGFSKSQVVAAINKMAPGTSVQDMIKEGLTQLSGKAGR